MSPIGADIGITGQRGWIAAVVVKNVKNFSKDDAEFYLRHLYENQNSPPAQFFILLTQEKAFIWRGAPDRVNEFRFLAEVPTKEIFDRYLRSGKIEGWLQSSDLILLAFDWLSRIAEGISDPQIPAEQELDRIGLVPAMRGATLTMAA